jgi:hypothetical protein
MLSFEDTVTAGFVSAFDSIANSVDAVFGRFGDALAKTLIDGGNFAKSMKSIFKDLAKSIIA